MNYRKLYLNLVSAALLRNGKPTNSRGAPDGLESHHIIPRSWGGANHRDNRVYFTPREHAFAHYLLYKLGVPSDVHTYLSMSSNRAWNTKQIAAIRGAGLKKARSTPVATKESYVRKRPKSGYFGVNLQTSSAVNPYLALLDYDGMTYRIGVFADAKEAAVNYDIAVLQLCPERDRNFPDLSLIELRRLCYKSRVYDSAPKKKSKARYTPEQRKLIQQERGRVTGALRKGRKLSDETKRKMSESRKGFVFTAEARAKMSESAKARHARNDFGVNKV